MNYEQKYLKYKTKYLIDKIQIGGLLDCPIEEIKYPYKENSFNNNILLIVNNKKNRDDLKISSRENIDLDV